jgi:hypothetical protein
MISGNHGLLALAIIVVRLAIAAADRPNMLWAKPRNLCAGAGHVEDAACSGFLLAKQAGVALDAANAAAHFFPAPTAFAPVGTKIISASAAASKTTSLVFMVVSLQRLIFWISNQRLSSRPAMRNGGEGDACGGVDSVFQH